MSKSLGMMVPQTIINKISSCMKPIYDEPISYKEVKAKLIELNYKDRSRKIFSNKTKTQFNEECKNEAKSVYLYTATRTNLLQ